MEETSDVWGAMMEQKKGRPAAIFGFWDTHPFRNAHIARYGGLVRAQLKPSHKSFFR